MKNVLRQLRKREVLRSAGLYVGVCWILIQAADIVLPAFGAEDWIFQALIYIAIAGFPIIVILAWFFDVSEKGIALDAGHTEGGVPRFGERKMDFVVIALLAVALSFSLYLNFVRDPGIENKMQETAVQIAVFENRTDDEILGELVEARLAMLIEASPRVFAIEERLYGEYKSADVVLNGTIERQGPSLKVSVRSVELSEDKELFESTSTVQDEEDLLRKIEDLGRSILEGLDDASADDSTRPGEGFTRSIDAARAWAKGRSLEFQGVNQGAILSYHQAIENDSAFGLAYAHLALLQSRNGQQDEGSKTWRVAREHLDGLMERERLKVSGAYQLDVAGDAAAALDDFQELLKKYPAEKSSRSDAARAAFRQARFAVAVAESDHVLRVFNENEPERLRMARYARYAGAPERSLSEATLLLNKNPQNSAAMLQLALAQAAGGQLDDARRSYETLEDVSDYVALAGLGIADLDLYRGQYKAVNEMLRANIDRLRAAGEQQAAAQGSQMLAESRLSSGDLAGAILAAQESLELSDSINTRIAAALILVEADASEPALEIAQELSLSIRNTDRAYGQGIVATHLRQQRQYVEAIDLLRQALDEADLWRLHFELGRTYTEANMFAEAFLELQACEQRRGEAASVYLDDMPTLRYFAELYYWLGLAHESLGMSKAAEQSFGAFLELRPQGGAHVNDAAIRLSRLEES